MTGLGAQWWPGPSLRRRRRRRRRLRGAGYALVAALVLAAGCGRGEAPARLGADKVIDLPGAERPTEFDDLTYSSRLRRVLVPALDAGLYLVEPVSGDVTRFEGLGSVYSAAEGEGMVLIADRDRSKVAVVDPASGRVVASATTGAPPDYVRYVPATGEAWVTEKGDRAGIEIFRLGEPGAPALAPVAFVGIPEGPEGLTISDARRRAYTQTSDGTVVAVDVERRAVVDRWLTGCEDSHGIPALDERSGLLLAGCASGGKGVLLDVGHDGRRLATYSVDGDEALMAHAPGGHFYLRADPGSTIAALKATSEGDLKLVATAAAPEAGHCLTADDLGHYWTCDQSGAKLLRYAGR